MTVASSPSSPPIAQDTSTTNDALSDPPQPKVMPTTRSYQQELLDESIHNNIIIALDTGSGKTLIAVLRMKHEMDREKTKLSWFFAPTVALCEQQLSVIKEHIGVSVGMISGANEPDQWKDASLWENVLKTHRIIVSTPQVFLDALRHGYIVMGRDISLMVFDETHHAVDNHPYNRIMQEFYFILPRRQGRSLDEAVRPMILGLTASPIYGGNVLKAFQTIENNMDCTIRSARRTRDELAKYVHRPVFKHVMYKPLDSFNPPFSTNLAALQYIVNSINIEDDPYVKSLRQQLSATMKGTDKFKRLDQKLSKVISKQDSFTHRGLRDFARCAEDICNDLGPWAADWYVWSVMQKAKAAANPFSNIMNTWKDTEKAYLLRILDRVVLSPISYNPDDIIDDCSDKLTVLLKTLIAEKAETESRNELYSGLIFVQRRDTVLALREILSRHPDTNNHFRVGILLGTSENSHRHSFLDITRNLVNESQADTIGDFKVGEKNLIVSTAVAEEGLDIQACGSVIRWDPPPNMASWAQSRGRARRQRSTFTLMFAEDSDRNIVLKWENLERQMISLYNDPQRDLAMMIDDLEEEEDEEDDMEFRIESTGAALTLHSAVSHLSHFCAVIPNAAHVDNRPLYDLDPPEFPEGWHLLPHSIEPYAGPYGSKVTLPRTLPLATREFSTDRIYKTKISAHRHSAFMAYKALYDARLLNDNLLPITDILEPELEEEVKAMLADVERREGTAKVSLQMDPWIEDDSDPDLWWVSELMLDSLPSLRLFTRSEPMNISALDGPKLYRPFRDVISVSLRPVGKVSHSHEVITKARLFTRRVFWCINGSRMVWDDLDFSYLLLPSDDRLDELWTARRLWRSELLAAGYRDGDELFANARAFGKHFEYPSDLTIVGNGFRFAKAFQFVRWRYEPLTEEEEKGVHKYYQSRFTEPQAISYPLLVVKPFPPRTNFLVPLPPARVDHQHPEIKLMYLIPEASSVTLLSFPESEYAFLLPSILRSLSLTMTVNSLRNFFFASSVDLSDLPLSLLKTAMTAPVTSEPENYQRLETLGDTVLKLITGIQLLAEYPTWHEGYLSRKKDHAVSNVRLAKENISRGLYRWIIRDRMLGKKWKPKYFSQVMQEIEDDLKEKQEQQPESDSSNVIRQNKKKTQNLSTKVLADVVESLIGAAYLYGGFNLGYECIKFFDLGLKWEPLPTRIDQMLSRVEAANADFIPEQIQRVEQILGYTFEHKLILIEALTHASYQNDTSTPSYERMEFLGDSVLDMVVTAYLYHAPGKSYTPGHIFLRKSALVNAHILAYICLGCKVKVEASMPRPNAGGQVILENENQEIHLWQCLLHSSPKILEDQSNTAARYRLRAAEIESALEEGSIFPWAALTRLQAPKFFSDMIESVIGAVYLDSGGNIESARQVMHKLGLTQILERIVRDNIDVLHPVSRLALWASKHDKKLEYKFPKVNGNVSCVIALDGKDEVEETDVYRGQASQEEVRLAAAEKAIRMFHLRDVGINHTLMKKKTKTKSKSRKKPQVEVFKN